MLDDLRRIIESEMEYDDLNDIMMEATDNTIADMFIEEDGEAIISDAEVMSILEKIPEYDEESAMNKKLARIAEAYIPEELSYVEEGLLDGIGKKMKVKPMVHVGNIQFGMKRSIVNKLLLRNKQEMMEDQTLDSYKHLEIKYDDNDKVIAVKIIGLESDVLVNGLGKVSKNFNDLCNLVNKVDPDASISSDRCTSNKLAMRAFGVNGETKTLIFGVKNLFAVNESFDFDEDDITEEGLIGRFKMRKMSNNELRSKIDELEADSNNVEAGKYKAELERRLKKEEKKNKKNDGAEEQPAQESYESDELDYLYETFDLEDLL